MLPNTGCVSRCLWLNGPTNLRLVSGNNSIEQPQRIFKGSEIEISKESKKIQQDPKELQKGAPIQGAEDPKEILLFQAGVLPRRRRRLGRRRWRGGARSGRRSVRWRRRGSVGLRPGCGVSAGSEPPKGSVGDLYQKVKLQEELIGCMPSIAFVPFRLPAG